MKQIVISIPDEIYLDIKYRFSVSPIRSPHGAYIVESAINDGIVLPEGHERLVDVIVESDKKHLNKLLAYIKTEETIVPADTEDDEDEYNY